jgi:hypothetical protein
MTGRQRLKQIHEAPRHYRKTLYRFPAKLQAINETPTILSASMYYPKT